MKMVNDIPVWGDPLEEAVKQMKEASKHHAVYSALMADHHIGYSVPVGGVIAYEGRICVNGVGFDIACGNRLFVWIVALMRLKVTSIGR